MQGVVFIADVGINHNSSLEIARTIIAECHKYGVDYVKFQKRNPDKCVPESQKNQLRQTPWGEMTYLDYRKKVELSDDDYVEIDKYCRLLGQKWFMSVWDIDSLFFALLFDHDYIKVPSAKITDKELLFALRSAKTPIILSTGGATLDMIDEAVKILHPNIACIMQCTSNYPCSAEEINLRCIENYRLRYPGVKIGFSNHYPGMTANIGSVFLGAEMLEVHVTLNTCMWGSDHASSCPVDKIPYLMKHLETATAMRGSGKKEYYESERTKMEQLRT